MNVDRVLAEIEPFTAARVMKKLSGGPASDSYLVERDAERFVLRIDTGIAAAFGLDRQAEVEILTLVSQTGLGPVPEFADPGQGILVTRYVEGRAWTENDLRDPERIRSLAALLRQLHALEPQGCHFDIHEKVDRYARAIGTPEGDSLAENTRELLRKLDDASVSQCLCHNDLTCANIIEGQGLTLIDWEYAAIGDPLFDLATIVEHHRFNAVEEEVLLGAYFDTASAKDIGRYQRHRVLYRYLLVLWLTSVGRLGGLGPEQQNRLRQEWALLKTGGSL